MSTLKAIPRKSRAADQAEIKLLKVIRVIFDNEDVTDRCFAYDVDKGTVSLFTRKNLRSGSNLKGNVEIYLNGVRFHSSENLLELKGESK